MERKEKITHWVTSHRDEMLEDLKTLCRVRSVAGEPAENAPYGTGPAQALATAMEMGQRCGFAVKNYDWRVAALDMGAPEGRQLDILAHLDVVGEGDGWDTDPYEPVVKDDGFIYGRGVADDKGGAVAALYAMRCVRELGLPMTKGCRLLLGTDEESGFSDMTQYYKVESPAPMTFSPDAEFPVCNAEKGFYRLRFRKHWGRETALPRVALLNGGFRVNVVPTEASAVVVGMNPMHLMAGASPLCAELGASCRVEEVPEGAKITVTGRGCHAASPESGINGNTVLIHVLGELPLADCASTRALHELDRLLPHGDFYGAALGIAQEDEITGKLTCSFTQIDFTADGLEGLCDCRIPLCATAENCKDTADASLTALGYEPAGMMVAPHYTPAETPFIQTLLQSYETFTGKKGACFSMGGATYVHDVPGGVAFGVGMPGVDVRMHGANERFPVEDLFTSVTIFADAIAALCE